MPGYFLYKRRTFDYTTMDKGKNEGNLLKNTIEDWNEQRRHRKAETRKIKKYELE